MLNNIIYGNCIICDKKTNLRCGYCHIPYYCSVNCKLNDFDNHKILCRTSLQEYCKNLVNLHKDGCMTRLCGDFTINISSPHHILKINNKETLIQIRKIWHDLFCAICGDHIFLESFHVLYNILEFNFNDKLIQYSRCDKCILLNKYICTETFNDSKQCYIDYKKKLILFIFIIKNNLPKELINLIIKICISINCCKIYFIL